MGCFWLLHSPHLSSVWESVCVCVCVCVSVCTACVCVCLSVLHVCTPGPFVHCLYGTLLFIIITVLLYWSATLYCINFFLLASN